jgi:hypothetical protein
MGWVPVIGGGGGICRELLITNPKVAETDREPPLGASKQEDDAEFDNLYTDARKFTAHDPALASAVQFGQEVARFLLFLIYLRTYLPWGSRQPRSFYTM